MKFIDEATLDEMVKTACNYFYGENGKPFNFAKAAKLYAKAAKHGHATAQLNLGSCYANGQGVKQSYAKAIDWWLEAAKLGQATAQYNLGLSYAKGQGVRQSYVKAKQWFIIAAQTGHEGSIQALESLRKIGY